MELKFEIPQVRVVKTCDYKGNPVAYLEVLGAPVLYATPDRTDENSVGGLSVGAWEDIFRTRLAAVFAELLLKDGRLERWSEESPTGRDVHLMDTVELKRED
jgi:hypothetical protein